MKVEPNIHFVVVEALLHHEYLMHPQLRKVEQKGLGDSSV